MIYTNLIWDNINNQSIIEKKIVEPSIDISPLAIVSHLSTISADVYFWSSVIVSIENLKKANQELLEMNNQHEYMYKKISETNKKLLELSSDLEKNIF